MEDFDPLTFELEGKIQQSKPLIEQCCQILLRSSSSIHIKCKSSTNHICLKDFVDTIRAFKIVPFKNLILIDKLRYLSDLLEHLYECRDSKELLEYKNFVHAFTEYAACLLCMCWTKEEANEEDIATEMNNLLIDMLYNIKPCVFHVTASYFAVLKSNNLWQFDDDSISQGQTLARFVDFFFEHTVLEDIFFILRECLIHLFTFVTQTPAQEEEEGDAIRTQIYAIFHEGSYLLLPISLMKQDFSNNKMLLNDFMIKIDILNTKIIHLYCTPSDSWNTLETMKMNYIYFASLQRELCTINTWHDLSDEVRAEVDLYIMEIRFLRLFFQCFETWDDSDNEETKVQLHLVVTSLQRIWGQEYDTRLLLGRLYSIRVNIDPEHLLDIELKEKLQMSKQQINAWLVSLSHCSYHCRNSTSNKIIKFLDLMSDLVSVRPCKDVAFKKQTEILEEKLLFLNNLLKLAMNCTDSKNLEQLNMIAQVFANNTTCLIYLYWAKEADANNLAESNLMFSNILQNIKPDTPNVVKTYIETFKTICLQPYDYLLFEQTALSFVDYFFQELTTHWKNDFQILRDDVMFLLTFIHHHYPPCNTVEIICSQLDVLFNDSSYELLPFDDINGDLSKKMVGLTDFMLNIGTENAKIRQLYCKFPDSFVSSFPRMIGQGFLDILIRNLRNLMQRMINDEKCVPCAKFKVKTIEEELLSLTPIFNQIMELKDLDDASLEVVNVVYLAEHVISLCHIFYHLLGHYIPCLSDVVDIIKAVRSKLENIKECDIINSRRLSHLAGPMSTPLLQQVQTSEIHGKLVGFKEDEKILIENIIGGTKSLDIVSIVGMGGLGKTTLAKKIYGSSSVKSHFNVLGFTSVSQYHDK